MPLITIGIPTYNRADGHLKVALESALNQTHENLEILISDNCSTDNTQGLVSSYKDSRIRYVRQESNVGANNNFNFCVENARGEYFLLLHDDDFIEPDFIHTCISSLKEHVSDDNRAVGFVCTGTRIVDGNGNVVRTAMNRGERDGFEGFLLDWLEGKTELYLCSTLFNTAHLRRIGGFRSPTHLLQDVAAILRLVAVWGRINVPAVKANFRRHDANRGSLVGIEDWCTDSLYLLDLISQYATQNESEIRKRAAFFLCRKCYRHTQQITVLSDRIRARYTILRHFKDEYSPLRFVVSTNLRPYVSGLRTR